MRLGTVFHLHQRIANSDPNRSVTILVKGANDVVLQSQGLALGGEFAIAKDIDSLGSGHPYRAGMIDADCPQRRTGKTIPCGELGKRVVLEPV